LLKTNPLITDEKGNEIQLFDFRNISKLTNGIDSLEKFIDNELNSGFMKVIFINNFSSEDSSANYEPFVVNNVALNHNLWVYKNELWREALNASKVSIPSSDKFNPNLYIDGKINTDLFKPDSSGRTIYSHVLEVLKNNMSNIFAGGHSEKLIDFSKPDNPSTITTRGYLKALILANFDNFVINKHAERVTVNLDPDSIGSFGIPTNGDIKYKQA
jgi:hypothetical protein